MRVFFTCDDSVDILRLESPEEAVEEAVEAWFDHGPNPSIDEAIKRQGSLKIYEYHRKKINSGLAGKLAENLIDSFHQNQWADNYGGDDPPWEHGDYETVKAKLTEVVQECLDLADVWRCEVVASRTIGENEIATMLKAHVPEWWSEDE